MFAATQPLEPIMDKRLLAEDIVHNVLINKNTGDNSNYTKNYKHLNKSWKEIYLNINCAIFAL